ncbi:MAG TPA: sterol desaturase family protein [Acidimicrobiales bacterium]|nr:sterol desaturase family protein [Acidimicrobiales bacterium]
MTTAMFRSAGLETVPRVEPATRRRSLIASISRRVYLPAVSLAAVATVLITIGLLGRWGGSSYTATLTSLRVVLVGPATLTILAIFLVVERLRPAQRRPIFARGYRQDLLYTVLNATVVAPLVVALSLSFAEVLQRTMPWIEMPRLGALPRWGVIALIFVTMDFCNWFAHLSNHRVRFLWRFHELHHSQEDMSVLTVFRTHPLVHVSYLIALIPGVVLIANGVVPTSFLIAYGAVLAFEHSNTNLGFGPLERVLVSPNYHRIHHRLEGRQDVNLGFALTVWDQLTHRAIFPTSETIRMDTGLPGRPLAVEQAGVRPRHLAVFGAQLIGPFRPLSSADDGRAPAGSPRADARAATPAPRD